MIQEKELTMEKAPVTCPVPNWWKERGGCDACREWYSEENIPTDCETYNWEDVIEEPANDLDDVGCSPTDADDTTPYF